MNQYINRNGKIYLLKFGLKQINVLSQFLNNIENPERIKFILSQALDDYNLTSSEINDIILNEKNIEQKLEAALKESSEHLSFDALDNIYKQVEELYQKAVGEINIAPSAAWAMTPHEIELAYAGYLRRKELEANCMLIALRRAKDSKAQLIELLPPIESREISEQEREATLKALDI